jgi:hypothetical protein
MVMPPDFLNALWVGLIAFALTPFMILPAALADRRNARQSKVQ